MAREVDALGGQMGVTTDFALTHIRRVGTGKGPAVQTLRAHVCKILYPKLMQAVMGSTEGLTLIEGRVETVLTQGDRVVGVSVCNPDGRDLRHLEAASVVLTTGTFLNGLCHQGSEKTVAARQGDQAVFGLSRFLADSGVRLRRFKTGTTPRVSLKSLQLDSLLHMESEDEAGALSFLHDRPKHARPLYGCWQTHTSATTHAVLAERLHESAMYSGQIEGVGPRYCPSIEDKIVRFADKDRHPIFLEIEEWDGDSVYVQGFSTSLPADAQLAALRTIEGMENVEVIRYGYAVEYDMADPTQLDATLMSKLIPGMFLAGQLNGTSGYEEAAAQGIVAGINAARYARNESPITFGRDQAFLGVMIDDLVTKGVEDPYRMLTARAEHRLILRHDNADQRLTPIARELGLADDTRWQRFEAKMSRVDDGLDQLRTFEVAGRHNNVLADLGHTPVTNKMTMFDLLKRPGFCLNHARELAIAVDTPLEGVFAENPDHVREALDQVELTAKYDGYLQIQERVAGQQRKLDDIRIPDDLRYDALNGISYETIEKLSRLRPSNLGQASRIPGIRPTDIALLAGILSRRETVQA